MFFCCHSKTDEIDDMEPFTLFNSFISPWMQGNQGGMFFEVLRFINFVLSFQLKF